MSVDLTSPRPEDWLFFSTDFFVFDFDGDPGLGAPGEAAAGQYGDVSLPPVDGDQGTGSLLPLDAAWGAAGPGDGSPPSDAPPETAPLRGPDSAGLPAASAVFDLAAGPGLSGDRADALLSGWLRSPFAGDGTAAVTENRDGGAVAALDAWPPAASAGAADSVTPLPPSGLFDLPSAKGGNGGGKGGGKPPKDGDDGGDGTNDPVLGDYSAGSADGEAGYDIQISFLGKDWTVDLQQAFIDTADYFVSVISADIGGGGRYRGTTIDDLYVEAELTQIDGSGGVLGRAGPLATWTSNDLTAMGMMEFDLADATDFFNLGLWDDIVTHEMMHVLGFGTLWDYGRHSGLVQNGFQYVGANAVAAYNEVLGLTGGEDEAYFIPVETDGGSGTAGGHWDEEALTNELMTGYINDDGDPYSTGDNVLSEYSVMALADLGYAVSYEAWSDTAYSDPMIA